MKNLFFAVFFFVSVNSIYGQGPGWEWARGAGGYTTDEGYDIAVDAVGNAYVTGWFGSPSISFGGITLNNSGPSHFDIFLVKLDNNGNVIWAKNPTGKNSEGSIGVACDNNGNIYITGYFFSDSLTFDNITLFNSLPGFAEEFFIAKYNAAGNIVWAKSATGNWEDWGTSLALNEVGDVYVTGSFLSDSITFDNITLFNSNGFYDCHIFTVKYDVNGNILWAKSGNANIEHNYSDGITVDESGNSYITGQFQGDSITFDNITLYRIGIADIFIVKYDPLGNVIWAKSAYGSFTALSHSISVDANANIYIAGEFGGNSITLDAITLLNDTTNGTGDAFIAKYNSAGNCIWAKRAGGSNGEVIYDIALDPNGNIYATGTFSSNSITFDNTTLYNNLNSYWDVFVVKLNSFGNTIWLKGAKGIYNDWSNSIAIDALGNSYITGFSIGTISFGIDTLLAQGLEDIFVAKLSSTVGINEPFVNINNSNALHIYPNPAHHILTVAFKTPTAIIHAALTDLTGRMILEKTLAGVVGEGKIEIDVSGVAKGVYVVKVAGPDNGGREERGMVVIE